MRVTRLEIFGFKSFMERLVIPLEGGITGVVGPNGCGKSNVVDALRWVLGESRASSLRGDVLEDIIFSGTEKLRPLGLAEVSMCLRSTGKDFFSDLVASFQSVELMPSRTDDGSVNAEDLKEQVVEAESAVRNDNEQDARPKLTVISGKVAEDVPSDSEQSNDKSQHVGDELLSAVINEEVEVEGKKAEPAPFLTRYSWLSGTQEVQVTRRIYRSGESEFFINRVPCRLRDIKEFFRIVGLGARAHSIVAQGEISRMISAKPEDRRVMFEEAAGVLGFKDKIAAANRRLEETGINISRIDDIVKEVTKQVASLKRQAQRAEMRQELKERVAELDAILFVESDRELLARKDNLNRRFEGLRTQEQSVVAELEKKQAEETHARAEMMGIDVESDALRARIDAIKEELNNRLRARSSLTSRLNELKAFTVSRGAEMERVRDRLNTLEQRTNSNVEELAQLELKEAELVESLRGLENVSQDDIQKASRELEDLRRSLKNKEEQIRQAREQFVALDSRARAIEEQLVSLSPAEQLKRTLGGAGSEILSQAKEGIRLFADGIRVPAALEKGVQAVLGEKAAFLVSTEPYSIAKRFSQSGAKNAGGNTSAKLGIGILRAGSTRGDTSAVQTQGNPPGRPLLDLIEVQDYCADAAYALLANMHFIESLDEAMSFFEQENAAGRHSELRFVTADGEIVSEVSFVSFRSEGGLIPMKNRVSELREQQKGFEQQVEQLRAEKDELSNLIQKAETERDQALARAAERQRKAREVANQLGEIRGRSQAEKRVRDQVLQDTQKLQQQLKDSERSILEYKNQESEVAARIEQLVPEGEAELQEELKGLQVQQTEIDSKRGQGRRVAALAASAVESLRKQIDQLRSGLNQAEMEVQKVTLEEQHVEQRFIDEYGVEIALAVREKFSQKEALAAETTAKMKEEALSIRNRIAREGEVDPTSIERFAEETKRLEELTTQRADLEKAASTLKDTIERLSDTSRQLFLKTYEGVSAHFERLIPKLFGGGKGELRLSDPANPLQSGVEVMVRPPGKKANSIELLSGGEKALCATALIFAMFLERPSPLCVLDEVDAPLDEANLVRFVSMVKEMSDKTQFIMITHNKQSMANADRLVGVTMQEPGASKILTVSLDEAYSQVA
jgi:chromosome segregation protein